MSAPVAAAVSNRRFHLFLSLMQIRKLVPSFLILALSLLLNAPSPAQTKKPTNVGISVQDLGNPFFVQIVHGAEAKVKEINPTAKITSLSCDYDPSRQTSQIDDFISQSVDLVILNAADSKSIAPAVQWKLERVKLTLAL
jgi:ribose transport system substrate-binding protein